MVLSKACEYGVKAVVCIAINTEKGQKVSLKHVANNIESPEAYTSKILQKLVKANLIQSIKGAAGGFVIDNEIIKTITLWDIVNVIDGIDITEKCMLGMKSCSNLNPCPIHDSYKPIRANILRLMKETFIRDLSKKVQNGESVLKN
jgi:Rrf2 family transcriptional regulator, iron-sulfur cluster assembly transcription factor